MTSTRLYSLCSDFIGFANAALTLTKPTVKNMIVATIAEARHWLSM